jgi:hypothetical protein
VVDTYGEVFSHLVFMLLTAQSCLDQSVESFSHPIAAIPMRRDHIIDEYRKVTHCA